LATLKQASKFGAFSSTLVATLESLLRPSLGYFQNIFSDLKAAIDYWERHCLLCFGFADSIDEWEFSFGRI